MLRTNTEKYALYSYIEEWKHYTVCDLKKSFNFAKQNLYSLYRSWYLERIKKDCMENWKQCYHYFKPETKKKNKIFNFLKKILWQ